MRRVLSINRSFYFDDSNGAAVANRSLLRSLARLGFRVEALSGAVVDTGVRADPADLLARRSLRFEVAGRVTWFVGAAGIQGPDPPHLRLVSDGVGLTIHHRPTGPIRATDIAEAGEFLSLVDLHLERFRPDVLLTYGGDPLTCEVLARARRRDVTTVFALHNFDYRDRSTFVDVDRVTVPSRFAADHYERTLGLDCTVLPGVVEPDRVLTERHDPKHLTFVNPLPEKGVYAVARIADELGRRRPDIPILVVESRGTESTLNGCGIDLRQHGNLSVMPQTPDPRDFWCRTRVCLMPSLWWESQGLVAVEAMTNGIPIIASDRGALPETLGEAGIVLPLPDRLTPATRLLPTAEEVAPWVEAVIRLWDDPGYYAEHGRRVRSESRRWTAEMLEPLFERFFNDPTQGPSLRLLSRSPHETSTSTHHTESQND